MQVNMGTMDRVIRVIAGLGLLSLFFVLESNLRWLSLVGVVLIGTALASRCPVYAPLGIKTCATIDKSR